MSVIAAYIAAATAAAPIANPVSQPPVILPITLSKEEVTALTTYLAQLPYGESAPLIEFLRVKEEDARKEAK